MIDLDCKETPRVGDIVYTRFPTEEGGSLPHYCLVLTVETQMTQGTLVVAYGSSKKVSRDGHTPTEIVVFDHGALAVCGLQMPTRFDLGKRARIRAESAVRTGALPRKLYVDLKKAAIAAGLL